MLIVKILEERPFVPTLSPYAKQALRRASQMQSLPPHTLYERPFHGILQCTGSLGALLVELGPDSETLSSQISRQYE
jgi:hypothetical protein